MDDRMSDMLSRADGKRDFARWLKDLGDDDVAGMRMALKLLMVCEGGNDGSDRAVTSYLKEKLNALGDEIELRKGLYFNDE